jgi:hypothetical protein
MMSICFYMSRQLYNHNILPTWILWIKLTGTSGVNVIGIMVKVFDFKPLALHGRLVVGLKPTKDFGLWGIYQANLWISCQLVVLLGCSFVSEKMHGGPPQPVKLKTCHIITTVSVQHKTKPKNKQTKSGHKYNEYKAINFNFWIKIVLKIQLMGLTCWVSYMNLSSFLFGTVHYQFLGFHDGNVRLVG